MKTLKTWTSRHFALFSEGYDPPSTFLQTEVQFLKFMHVMVCVQQINYLVMIM
jgi:hypothetical protein